MPLEKYRHWQSALASSTRPAYLMIADLIEQDIEKGTLQRRDRLPPLRDLAKLLELNYTTVTRAYKEASHRGLIDSHPGSGSYIKGRTATLPPRNGSNIEMTMNLPPEPEDPILVQQIRQDMVEVSTQTDLACLLRYQDFGGTIKDKESGAQFLHPVLPEVDVDRLLVCPGIHTALLALLSVLCKSGKALCVEKSVYPGLKAISAQLGIQLVSVECDADGPIIRSLEALCKSEKISALYLNPTLQNPTTNTMSLARRQGIADVAIRYNLPIIEDDAYGLLASESVTPIARLVPELTYYVSGLAKVFGAGSRTAYLYAPNKLLKQRLSGALRALAVMASPITTSLATRWIQNGTLRQVMAMIREESAVRHQLIRQHMTGVKYRSKSDAFHFWLQLPATIKASTSEVAQYLQGQGISAVAAAAFCTDNNPQHALRVSLGGGTNREKAERDLLFIRDMLDHPEHVAGVSF